MTGPNPDAELDNALGINQLPPAVVTHEHLGRASELYMRLPSGEPTPDKARLAVERLAQFEADAEQRAVARYITELYTAGTGTTPAFRLDGAGDLHTRHEDGHPT